MEFKMEYRNCDLAPENKCSRGGDCEGCESASEDMAWRFEVGYDAQENKCIIFVDAFASDKNLLTVRDIAADLDVGKRTVRKYFEKGLLEGFKSEGKWVVQREKYREFKENMNKK